MDWLTTTREGESRKSLVSGKIDVNQSVWLDQTKTVKKQVKGEDDVKIKLTWFEVEVGITEYPG